MYWDKGKENGNYYLGFRVQGLGFRDNVDPCLINALLLRAVLLGYL